MERIRDSADVLGKILTLLPIKDAAKTSILSREWRHRWRIISNLIFDCNFASAGEGMYYSRKESEEVMTKILEALLAHDGPITKFELSISGLTPCHQLDLLMLYLSRRNVEQLALEYPDQLHSSLFSAFHLTSLKLRGCNFRPPSGSVLLSSKLTFLELEQVSVPDDFFNNFIASCPLLQELRILDCETGDLVFVAPSLKVLCFHSTMDELCLKNTPLLSVLSVLDPDDPDECSFDESDFEDFSPNMVALLASIPALEQLNLGTDLLLFFAADVHVPSQLPISLVHLKLLEIPRIALDRLPRARVLVCLIMSSPNLQKLTIGLDSSDQHPKSEVIGQLLEAEDYHGVSCLEHLEEFSIKDSRGMQGELDLVKFVLANAPLLGRVFIKPEKGLRSTKVANFLKEVNQYKRVSKDAEVRYIWSAEAGTS